MKVNYETKKKELKFTLEMSLIDLDGRGESREQRETFQNFFTIIEKKTLLLCLMIIIIINFLLSLSVERGRDLFE